MWAGGKAFFQTKQTKTNVFLTAVAARDDTKSVEAIA